MKFVFKGEFTPGYVDRAMYFLAPISIFVAALAAFAVIPFGSVDAGRRAAVVVGRPRAIALTAVPGLDVGLIYIFAVGSVAVYGVVLGRLGQQRQVQLPGRHAEQRAVDLLRVAAGAGDPRRGARFRTRSGWKRSSSGRPTAASGTRSTQPLGFAVFCVAGFAEAARLPFDLPEAEQELVGGYHTEYFGVKLMMYMVAEFLHMVLAAVLIVILFLGGWHLWGLTGSGDDVTWPIALVRIVVLLAKVMGVILFFMLARWSWPRFRYDQLMDIGWKVMIPWGIVNVVVVAVCLEYGGELARLQRASARSRSWPSAAGSRWWSPGWW